MKETTIDGITFSYFYQDAPFVNWDEEFQGATVEIRDANVDGVPFDQYMSSIDDEDEAEGWIKTFNSLETTILDRKW